MKKALSMVLAIALTMTMGLTGWADEPVTEMEQPAITLEGDEAFQQILNFFLLELDDPAQKQQALEQLQEKQQAGEELTDTVIREVVQSIRFESMGDIPNITPMELTDADESIWEQEPVIIPLSEEEKQRINEENLQKKQELQEQWQQELGAEMEPSAVETELPQESTGELEQYQPDAPTQPNSFGMGQRPSVDRVSKAPMLAAGYNHTILLRPDGSVYTWGVYSSDLFGSTLDTYATPYRLPNLASVVQVASGNIHGLALKSDGTVWTWGSNLYGQLGNGTFIDRMTPEPIVGLDSVVAIAAGTYHSVALKSDGTVWIWGQSINYSNGEITYEETLPKQVVNQDGTPVQDVIAIAGADWCTFLLKSDGSVWSFGVGYAGQLGQGSLTSQVVEFPAPVQRGDNGEILTGISHIVARGIQVYALTPEGDVWAWGAGDLGEPHSGSVRQPQLMPTLSNITAILAGGAHTFARQADGTILAWGDNTNGEYGNGTQIRSSIPFPLDVTDVVDIAAGSNHSVMLKNDGTVWVTGDNSKYQLGRDRGPDMATTWESLVKPTSNTIAISQGTRHTLILHSDGSIWSGGGNGEGQLGHSGMTNVNSVFPATACGQDNVAIAAGAYHSLSLKNDGTVLAWGRYADFYAPYTYDPVIVPADSSGAPLSNVTQIAAGGLHNLALKSDGTVWAWGDNPNGQLGNGALTSSKYPVQVITQEGAPLEGVIAISSGWFHSLALKSDGTVYIWGRNNFGQIADGSFTDQPYAVPVRMSAEADAPLLSGITAIAGGGYHNLALTSQGEIYAWGKNMSGEVGNGDIDYFVTSPQKVKDETGTAFLNHISTIYTGGEQSFAIADDNTVYAWGDNSQGQLGTGNQTDCAMPVSLYQTPWAGINNVASIANNASNTFVLTTDGQIFATGFNDYGMFGLGTEYDQSTQFIPACPGGMRYDDYMDMIEDAQEIALNKTIYGEFNSERDNDLFKFYAPTAGVYEVECSGDVEINLYKIVSDLYSRIVYPLNGTYQLEEDSYYAVRISGLKGEYSFQVSHYETSLTIGTPVFSQGLTGAAITTLKPGLVRGKFPVTNVTGNAKSVLIVTAVVEKSNNKYHDFALVEKLIPANTTEYILTGVTVPANAKDYELRTVVWDSIEGMNAMSNQIVFQ